MDYSKMPLVYPPAEDSYLLSEILKEHLPKLLVENLKLRFLEIGAGSGIHLQTAKRVGVRQENIHSCDINPDAVFHCGSLGFNCVHSDLFEKIDGKFDLIIFNPPYLPNDSRDKDPDTAGGKKGNEVILRFLKQAKEHLEENGKIFLILSSLTPKINIEKFGYKKKEIGCENLFMEQLCILELNNL